MKEVPYVENYEDGPKVEGTGMHCKWCGQEIVYNEEYVDIDGTVYHANCLFDRTDNYVAQAFGYCIRRAG